MSQETTYLELSEADGLRTSSTRSSSTTPTLTVRYGRIGDQGQVKTSGLPDNARARAAAAKKIGEKVRKGYAPAVPGVAAEARRSPAGRSSAPAPPPAAAPVLWRYDSGAPAFGIFVDEAALHGSATSTGSITTARPRRPGARTSSGSPTG